MGTSDENVKTTIHDYFKFRCCLMGMSGSSTRSENNRDSLHEIIQ